ncbi:C1 family peptidase [Scrofimicrobium sp. R131]|uniref:Aminopeptidase n=1 Tax=Scrofimicrobium appendicitidis TaxID=3079930 RepID=A0AAU7VBU3_9ACTO
MSPALTPELIERCRSVVDSNSAARLSRNAVTLSGLDAVSLDRAKATTPTSMSTKLDKWKVTNQKKSGRCWLFAALNLMRVDAMEKMGLKDFQLSQNYAVFWEKFERSNYFLEDQISLAEAGEPLDSRLTQFLLADVLNDGGQWDMLVGVFEKYGVVPQEAMPETEASSNTGRMNSQLRLLLRRVALELRELPTVEARRELKAKTMEEVYQILVINLGVPPRAFDWQWRDQDGQFHRDGELTPLEFKAKYVSLDLTEYVCLVDDPRTAHPKNAPLTVDHLGNVVGGPSVLYLNVDISVMKELAARSLRDGHPVWFGCDVGQQSERKAGLLVADLYDYQGVLGVDLTTTKEQRVLMGESLMTHAMVLTGVDEVDGQPRRWRVENSWGDEIGDQGFFTMDDQWFSDYVFEVVVKKAELPEQLRAALTQEPLVLPAWDPMGALA